MSILTSKFSFSHVHMFILVSYKFTYIVLVFKVRYGEFSLINLSGMRQVWFCYFRFLFHSTLAILTGKSYNSIAVFTLSLYNIYVIINDQVFFM